MAKKFIKWEGDIYCVDIDSVPAVLVKEGNTFVSKPDLGKLCATILFEGMPLSKEEKSRNLKKLKYE